jgi:hypothetical protein
MNTTSYPAPGELLEEQRSRRSAGMSRRRAFLTHLGFSASIVALTCAVIFLVWYPHPYFQAAGAWHPLQVLIGVDLIVFKPGKKGLRFDVAFIVVVQLTAFVYGVHVLYSQRPYFNVFSVDRFALVPLEDVDATEWAEASKRIGSKPFAGPLEVVAVRPTETAAMQRLIDETVLRGKPDIDHRPEFWRPYAEHTAEIAARARPFSSLHSKSPEMTARIKQLPARLGLPENRLGVVPLAAGNRDLSLVIDTATAAPLEVLDVDPWADE